MSPTEKSAIVESLVARPETAMFLLEQLRSGDGQLRREDITPFHARQILSLDDARLTELLGEVWGSVRPSTEQQEQQKQLFRQQLSPENLSQADLRRGRQLFTANCSQCHRLFGEGAMVGPELTGAQRSSLDYLLENLVSPSAVVPSEYRMAVIVTEDGRTLNGLVVKDDGRVVELQTLSSRMTIPKDEIQVQRLTEMSSMPEGLLEGLNENDRRDLIAYLMQTTP
jgi:putative heme-binding domain-containing protein